MAAIFYNIPNSDNAIFKGGISVNTSVSIPGLDNLINSNDMLVINEFTIMNKDTIQYFLTFDDLISYFYFGKGLGTISVNASLFSQCPSNIGPNLPSDFRGLSEVMQLIQEKRGMPWEIYFGGIRFDAVLSSFTFRASAADIAINIIDFTMQLEVIQHSFKPPTFKSACYDKPF